MKRTILTIYLVALLGFLSIHAADPVLAPSFAWKLSGPLGMQKESTIDTIPLNFSRQVIPTEVSDAWATTGNLGAEGMNLIYMDRPAMSDFFFADGLTHWYPTLKSMKFYNTRIPMTLLTYTSAGGRDNSQERLQGTFSGNINKRAQIGALFDYLYSKGSYAKQAVKDMAWGFSGSYIGDRYEFQGFYNHYDLLNKENGGITDDLYITDPAELQGGQSYINAKDIPVRLNDAHTRFAGQQLYLNNKYNVGFWKEEIVDDTVSIKTYVPVSSFIWALDYKSGRHIFHDTNKNDITDFFKNTYIDASLTNDSTTYHTLTNTLGISLLEGFNKYAKAGLAVYARHQLRSYRQTLDTLDRTPENIYDIYTPLPEGVASIKQKETQNLFWVGAQLTKRQGHILNYEVNGRLGIIGPVAGDIEIDGNVSTHLPLFGDTVNVIGYGALSNLEAPYLMQNYISNHFAWKNDFGKTRRVRFGGILNIPHTGTAIDISAENVQNLIYFDSQALPAQASGSTQVFSARLHQNIHAGILHWDNTITYQTTSDDKVIPLPKLSVYSNLYITFKVAKVLHVQLGIDCDYYTKYYSVDYQPATASFFNQREIKTGGYPFMNAYANMKLSKTRFFVLFSHVNQGLFGDNYFIMPHYPMNPRRFQIGLTVDFAN